MPVLVPSANKSRIRRGRNASRERTSLVPGAGMGEKPRKVDEAIGFDEHVEQVQDAIALVDGFFDQTQAARFGLRLQPGERP